jgi:hypothetical protein
VSPSATGFGYCLSAHSEIRYKLIYLKISDGPIEVDTLYEKLAVVEARLASRLQMGGLYRPTECKPRYRVAVVVPYRDREQHLPVFLKNLHVFLMKQQIEYGIFIVEQASGEAYLPFKLKSTR